MVLELSAIPKVFFDVQNDSDALYSHFAIKLAGIEDIQLMELATRTFLKKYVNGLSKCIEKDARMSLMQRVEWKSVKEKGVKLFNPKHSGSYEVFNTCLLAKEVREYCIQDVQFMPKLWAVYSPKLTSEWQRKVDIMTNKRVA